MTNLINTKQAAELLGVSAGRVRQLAQNGLLQGQHIGRDWVFEREHVQHFFEGVKRKSGRPRKTNLLELAIRDTDTWRNRAISQHAVIEFLIEAGLPPGVDLIKKDGWYIGIRQEAPQ